MCSSRISAGWCSCLTCGSPRRATPGWLEDGSLLVLESDDSVPRPRRSRLTQNRSTNAYYWIGDVPVFTATFVDLGASPPTRRSSCSPGAGSTAPSRRTFGTDDGVDSTGVGVSRSSRPSSISRASTRVPCRRHRPDGRRRALDRGSPVPIRQPLTRAPSGTHQDHRDVVDHRGAARRRRPDPRDRCVGHDDVVDRHQQKSSPSRSWPRPQG